MDTEVTIDEVLVKALSTEEVKTIGFLKEIGYEIKNDKGAYVPWYEYRRSIVDKMTEEHFKTLYTSKPVMKFLDACFGNDYVVDSIYEQLYAKFPHLAYDILKNSPRSSLVIHLIKSGFHKGIEDINALAESDDVQARMFAVDRCSHDVLKKLRKDSNKNVRLAAYKRLGVDEYLDEMLDDKVLDVRLAAAEAAPMYYPKFKDMTDELSKKVFKIIAAKIDVKHIPYILGNRNLSSNNASSKYIKAMLDKRLAMGNINDAEEE
jgi:hypothetical protein